jgi:outer membrane protein
MASSTFLERHHTTPFGLLLTGLLAPAAIAAAQTTQYIVQTGDTPCEIAESVSQPCAELIAANNLGANPIIYPGQILMIPSASQDPQPAEASAVAQSASEPSASEESVASAAGAGSKAASDLLAVYLLAKSQDPTFAAATYRYEASGQLVPQAQAARRPQLSASGSYTDATSDRVDLTQAGVSVSQSLYNKSTRISIDQANTKASQAELVFQIASESLISRAVRSYFTVLAANDNLELSRRNQTAIARQLELAQERLDVGLGTKTELFDASARFEKSVADTIESEKLLDDAKQALEVLVGEDIGDILPLPAEVVLGPPQPDDAQQWVDRALEQNASLQAKNLGIDLSSLEIDRQKAQRLPTVGLQVSGNYSDTAAAGSDTYSRLFLSVNIPFYQGGLINARVREAADNLSASQSDYDAAVRDVRRDTRQTFLGVKSRLRRLDALAAAVRAGENALLAKEESLTAGLTTNIAVLDAQRDLFGAQRDYLKERYDYVLQMLELERLSGDLNEDDVRRVNALLHATN